MAELVGPLEAGDTGALAPGFVRVGRRAAPPARRPAAARRAAAAVWPGDPLRAEYDRYDRAFKAVWRDWYRRQDP